MFIESLEEQLAKWFPFKIKDKENLDLLRERQKDRRLGVLICANHGATTDAIRITLLLNPLKREGVVGGINFVIAKDHINFLRDPVYTVLARLGEGLAGVETVPVVQAYLSRDPALGEERRQQIEEETVITGLALLRKAEEIAQNGCLVILPEGHRSQIEGQLQPAERGLRNLVGRFPIILPVGIKYPEKSSRGFGFGEEAELIIGQPLTREEIQLRAGKLGQEYGVPPQSLIHHTVMLAICDLLPESVWGVYHPLDKKTLTRVLKNEIVLRRSPDGRVLPMDKRGEIYPKKNR